MQRPFFLLLAIGLSLFIAGCRESAQPTPTPDPTEFAFTADISVDVRIDPDPPAVGDATLVIAIAESGTPLGNLPVRVRGDMNHAGMRPVDGAATTDPSGIARVPFEWTMGGDWILSIEVDLPSGIVLRRTIDLSVAS